MTDNGKFVTYKRGVNFAVECRMKACVNHRAERVHIAAAGYLTSGDTVEI